ncbi:LacI family transcriptional regulator [Pseudoflavonifractor sp. MSJ-30]|mgnify:FL=1|uniref:LacI family DNA-binding transcriptional regulator n=1 Tax=Pseudoflavonifractor sp. MSJ-30 TaxID=2841525 RepID=UPI001C1166D5|nr:LacI family DNA-binding transcriptional regulator [Pseudoflavonifractor sp. MSJ-30]MBU5452572.1 LacI family transcriptional regulator [Pseudoflavonifractor sp. MSJ-30]
MGVTIKDVAEAAGVSISTVSKVLNGHYSISEKTAERVRGIMREMNYYPNANAQSFASGSNHTVVLLANLSPNAAFRNPHMFEIIAGLEEALCRRGYRLILRGADATSACGIAEEIISRRSADAIAIHVGVMSHPLAAVLTRLRFPHIVLGAPDFESQVCWIDNSNTYSGAVAAGYLLSRGYRRLAFIGGRSYDLGSALRLQGVKQGLANGGERLEDQYIWLGESTRADGFRMTEGLLNQKQLPDAIICANNYIALGCVDAVLKREMRIPKDMGIMAFDDYPFSQIMEPPLTVVDINVRDMGAQAAKFLTDIIRHPNMQIQTYITTSNVIARGSTR